MSPPARDIDRVEIGGLPLVTPEPSAMGPSRAAHASDAGPNAAGPNALRPKAPGTSRPFLSIYFRCSAQYTRAYKNAKGDAYDARCPACGKPVRFAIGPGGSADRAFTMSCT